jgi:hypothetical protein
MRRIGREGKACPEPVEGVSCASATPAKSVIPSAKRDLFQHFT